MYEKLMSMKNEINAIAKDLRLLKKQEPSEENAKAILQAEKRIGEIKTAARHICNALGIAA